MNPALEEIEGEPKLPNGSRIVRLHSEAHGNDHVALKHSPSEAPFEAH
jgi:hypothetical protein